MKTNSSPRWLASTALALALGLLLTGAGTSFAKDEPAAAPAKALRVAILPILNGSQDLSAPKIMEDILREQLKIVPPARATFLLPSDSERILRERDQLGLGYRLTDKWGKNGTLDSTAVAAVDSIFTLDAILFVKINEWENHRVTVIGAGDSNTTIGFSFACFDVKTMKKFWFKDPREQRFGQEIDASSGAVNYDATGFIQNKRATDPPRYEDVAADLVRDAFKKFPAK
ncbi:MAG TPA: hypothetical protein VFS09_07125 [Candidatus Eisenbacteria bacterium]|nr:hypothetical protein [Candidatus Eisenbacteria bacterium]